MGALLSVAYGVLAYVLFLGSFLYAIGFVSNVVVPKSIDTGEAAPVALALAVNVLLLAVFAVQHSVMARPAFKRWWTGFVPPVVERSTFVVAASLALLLLYWQWTPMPGVIWSVQSSAAAIALNSLGALGWLIALVSTFLINHFELFGLRQVFARLLGRAIPQPVFRTPGLYRYVRHPLYLGMIIAFWATPTMTAGHLLFALATTGYVLIGVFFEERDLIEQFGERYRRYRDDVGMLLPRPARKKAGLTVTDRR